MFLIFPNSSLIYQCVNEWVLFGAILKDDSLLGMKKNIFTSSTAQGGGGSFKNRKPIGEAGCCESRMAERSSWWTERWFRSLSFSLFLWLPIYLAIYLSIYPASYLSIDLSIYLSVYLSLFHLSICLPVYLSICLSIYLSVYLSTCLSVVQCHSV